MGKTFTTYAYLKEKNAQNSEVMLQSTIPNAIALDIEPPVKAQRRKLNQIDIVFLECDSRQCFIGHIFVDLKLIYKIKVYYTNYLVWPPR